MSLALSVTQPAPSCSEHELVAAVRRGDDRAFEALYSRYRGRIGSYVLGMVGDHGRAEDIAQDVFISALRRLRNTERPIAFKPWIYEIAKNACIDEFRRTRRAQEVSLDGGGDLASNGGDLMSTAPTPDAAVESKQCLDDLCGAFGGLSESHHEIIVLRELEGLSYTQIGERMGMTRPVVESTLFRARRRLSEEYEELVSGRRCEQVMAVTSAAGSQAPRSIGVRQRRQLSRHLAHCQPCRRHAHMVGFDDSLLKTPRLPAKIGALLPIPWLRWRRGHGENEVLAASAPHQLATLQSLQGVVRFADPTAPTVGLGRAAAAAAALAIAGAGGGLATGLASHGSSHARPAASSADASGQVVHSATSRNGHNAPPTVVRGHPAAFGFSRSSSAPAKSAGGGAPAKSAGGGAPAKSAGGGAGAPPTSGTSSSPSSTGATVAATQSGAAVAGVSNVSRTVGSGVQTASPQVSASVAGVQAASSQVSAAPAGVGGTPGSPPESQGLQGAAPATGAGLPSSLPSLPQLRKLPLPQLGLPALPHPSTPSTGTIGLPQTPQLSLPSVPGVSVPNPGGILPQLGQ
jgi:RNA polymerase sigma factor (sigma-70 family)